ncbi:MAG TPA: hypothetical protein DDY20_00115 [Desulfobulbaceae bacterium]|nr:hypothetical protein [Desulfobulbaceae bacterium]
MKVVHVSAKIERRIEDLKKDGRAGRALARRVSAIIESLASVGGCSYLDAAGGYTRYGEKRIRNCRKYELGCGCRLVTLQRGEKVFVVFLGTHDECQRWLKNHSRLKEYYAGNGELFQIVDESPPPANPACADSAAYRDEAEEELLSRLSDQVLRRVFCGLVEGERKRTLKAQGHLQQLA